MSEEFQPGTIGAAIVALGAAVLAFFNYFPKFKNGMRSDGIDGQIMSRFERHENRMNGMDLRLHRQQVKITRLQVLIIQMEGLLVANGVKVPENVKTEIRELLDDDADADIEQRQSEQ